LANLARGMSRRTFLANYKVLKSPRVPGGPFSFSNPMEWCGSASRTDPLASSARVMALAGSALEQWGANHCRVDARLSDFLVVAASHCFLLLPVSLCPLVLKPASSLGAKLAWASRGGQCCRGGRSCSHVLALGQECASLDSILCGSGRSGLTLPVDLGRLFQGWVIAAELGSDSWFVLLVALGAW